MQEGDKEKVQVKKEGSNKGRKEEIKEIEEEIFSTPTEQIKRANSFTEKNITLKERRYRGIKTKLIERYFPTTTTGKRRQIESPEEVRRREEQKKRCEEEEKEHSREKEEEERERVEEFFREVHEKRRKEVRRTPTEDRERDGERGRESQEKTGRREEKLEGMETVLEEIRKSREERKEIKEFIMEIRKKWEETEERVRKMEGHMEEMEKEYRRRLKEMEETAKENKDIIEEMRGCIEKMEEKWEKSKEREEKVRREEKEKEGSKLRDMSKEIIGEDSLRKMVEKGIKEVIEMEGRSKEEDSDRKYLEERRWEEWERERRRNNIIISGLEKEKRSGKGEIEKWIEKELGVKAKLIRIWVIKGRKNMIGAECINKEEKEKIMAEKSNLKGTRIYIENDMTYKERRIREEIWKVARDMREQGRTAKIGYNKLIIDGEEYRWREEEGKLMNRKGKEVRKEEEFF